jgi:hypothetical protein
MIRRERLKRQRREMVEVNASTVSDVWPFAPDPRLEALRQPSRLTPTVTVGGQRYKEVDNGQAGVLVPAEDPVLFGRQREAFQLADTMAKSPLAGMAFGLASLLGNSPAAREKALAAGAATDSIIQSLAPFGARPVGRMSAAPTQAPAAPKWRDPVRLQNLNAQGQATGVDAIVTKSMLGTGTKAYWRLTPPGWQGESDEFNEARGHLLARELGGTGKDPRNLVTLTQNPANNPQMSGFERDIANRVRAGEVIDYRAVPMYDKGVLPPAGILVTATGLRGAPTAQIIPNPAGRPR